MSGTAWPPISATRVQCCLRNHGALTVGRNTAEAFELMYALETVCRIQLDVLATGREIILPPPAVAAKAAAQFEHDEEPAGERTWPGLLRLARQRESRLPRLEHDSF